MIAIAEPASCTGTSAPPRSWKYFNAGGGEQLSVDGRNEQVGIEEVVPDIDEGEQYGSGDRRPRQRNIDTAKNTELRSSVDAGGLVEIPRDRLEELREQHQIEYFAQLGKNDREQRIEQAERLVIEIPGDHRRFARNHKRQHEDHHQHLASAELQPGERESRRQCHDQAKDDRDDDRDDRIAAPVQKVRMRNDRREVIEHGNGRIEQRSICQARRPKRDDHHRDERIERQKPEDPHEHSEAYSSDSDLLRQGFIAHGFSSAPAS